MDGVLIDSIADEVKRRIREMDAEPLAQKGTLAIAASHVAAPGFARKMLEKRFSDVRYAVVPEDADGFSGLDPCAGAWNEKILLQAVASSQNVVLLSPAPETLIRMAWGEQPEFLERVILRAVLWEKKVTVMTDFKTPKFRRGTFFERLADAMEALSDMGIETIAYSCFAGCNPELPALVTGMDVEDAHAQNKSRIACAKGVIVTPAARDRAAELNIKIDW